MTVAGRLEQGILRQAGRFAMPEPKRGGEASSSVDLSPGAGLRTKATVNQGVKVKKRGEGKSWDLNFGQGAGVTGRAVATSYGLIRNFTFLEGSSHLQS